MDFLRGSPCIHCRQGTLATLRVATRVAATALDASTAVPDASTTVPDPFTTPNPSTMLDPSTAPDPYCVRSLHRAGTLQCAWSPRWPLALRRAGSLRCPRTLHWTGTFHCTGTLYPFPSCNLGCLAWVPLPICLPCHHTGISYSCCCLGRMAGFFMICLPPTPSIMKIHLSAVVWGEMAWVPWSSCLPSLTPSPPHLFGDSNCLQNSSGWGPFN